MRQTKERERKAAASERTRRLMNAIISGIERGNKTYDKVYDKALAIRVEIEQAGLRIINAPKKDGVKC